ncbi:hypothetical protein ACEZCY_35870 [Streptacidiphilus sp. N1-12]|uniref:Uncharacterized protein n=1 Tax=Streptacidiphilus alkalitolerans TaxID=3342712 RepID=A0ABV6WR89_9ACTN
MSTTTAPASFEDLARTHGKALAYIAGRDDNTVPVDPTSVDADGLIDLARNAAAFLSSAHHYDQAETLDSAAAFLTEARDADDADRPALLRRAARQLADSDELASELADELGEDYGAHDTEPDSDATAVDLEFQPAETSTPFRSTRWFSTEDLAALLLAWDRGTEL